MRPRSADRVVAIGLRIQMTSFISRLHLKGPLIVAPMGGGPTTPELVAASSNAGALGSLAGAYLNPSELGASISQVRNQTDNPFAVNLFVSVPTPTLSSEEVNLALDSTRAYREQL